MSHHRIWLSEGCHCRIKSGVTALAADWLLVHWPSLGTTPIIVLLATR
jgi:hypothetical protein